VDTKSDHTATISRCLSLIEQQLDWGAVSGWANSDFTELSDRILETTGVSLSPTTLKRVWGRVRYASQPSPATLDALAQFAGYDHWRDFRLQVGTNGSALTKSFPLGISANPQKHTTPASSPTIITRTPTKRWLFFGAAIVSILLSLLAVTLIKDNGVGINANDYHFTIRPVTSGIPNSVVFEYDASSAPNDSVYIQQSWDSRRRRQVAATKGYHTAIYYEPGYFRTKLIVGQKEMKIQELYLPAKEWIITAGETDPPVYFPAATQLKDGVLGVDAAEMISAGLSLQPEQPPVTFSWVDDLAGLRSDDFSFSTQLRNTYQEGAAVCQFSRVTLLLKNGAITFGLSQPGCVAELYALVPGRSLRGESSDLSAFGVDLSNWVDFDCTVADRVLTVRLNGKTIFTHQVTVRARDVIGVRVEFEGAGEIRRPQFRSSDQEFQLLQ